MPQNILQNFREKSNSKLCKSRYYDYMLHGGEGICSCGSDIDEMTICDFSGFAFGDLATISSNRVWSEAVNNGVILNDIGFTGVDNGYYLFDRDTITNEEFAELYINSTLEIPSGETAFSMTKVGGNTKRFEYPVSIESGESGTYISLKGGFYQGFFKLHGFDYEVLPSQLRHDMVLNFVIRPRSDYETPDNTINSLHPENKGIFFYMGTRGENKFWELYNRLYDKELTKFPQKEHVENETLPDCNGYGDSKNRVLRIREWLQDEAISPEYLETEEEESYLIASDSKSERYNTVTNMNTYDFNENSDCGCGGKGDNPDHDDDDDPDDGCPVTKKAIEIPYVKEDISIDDITLEDSEGHEFDQHGYYEIETDNKHIFFNHTKDGFTVNTWSGDTMVVLSGLRKPDKYNKFIYFNRTKTGFTTDDIDKFEELTPDEYDIYKDIRDNSFALRITENGAVGYRYGIKDCDAEDGTKYTLLEEYSNDGIVKYDQWNSITVRFALTNPTDNKCDNRKRTMRIMIYVNGFLKLISKEVTALNFKALDDVAEKQEGVPYNISLGGGTQGLLERIMPDYYDISKHTLPIERDFCGSFIGDIKSFKIIDGFVDYCGIKHNLSETI